MQRGKQSIWFALIALVSSQYLQEGSFYHAHPELDPYIQKFIAEGRKRGIIINIIEEDIQVEFGALEDNQAGKCRPYDHPKVIVINQDHWEGLDTLEKEILIFHELGHCILRRGHKNETLAHGECASLMNGKEDDFECSKNLYSKSWRQYYLDELFDAQVSLPTWYLQGTEYLISNDRMKDLISISTQKTERRQVAKIVGDIVVDETRDYQIEVIYEELAAHRNQIRLSWKDLWWLLHVTSDTDHDSNGNVVKIIRDAVKNCYEGYVGEVSLPLKLTLRKQNGFFHFFLNEKFVHQTDIEVLGEKQGLPDTGLEKAIHMAVLQAGDAGFDFKVTYLQ